MLDADCKICLDQKRRRLYQGNGVMPVRKTATLFSKTGYTIKVNIKMIDVIATSIKINISCIFMCNLNDGRTMLHSPMSGIAFARCLDILLSQLENTL